MQIIPYTFAKKLVTSLLNLSTQGLVELDSHGTVSNIHQASDSSGLNAGANARSNASSGVAPNTASNNNGAYASLRTSSRNQENAERTSSEKSHINVQPAYFEAFEDSSVLNERKNIHLIMDVPLQVTVELGRTNKPIRDILEFGPGSIIELEKLAGEPVDILVNGKNIAKGEVVVIDESFGVRITDIIDPSKRL
jgi:flagellar motor switch protein FliN/FliY